MRKIKAIFATLFVGTPSFAQQLDLSNATGSQPVEVGFARSPRPTAWEQFTNDPSAQLMAALVLIAVIALIIYLRRRGT